MAIGSINSSILVYSERIHLWMSLVLYCGCLYVNVSIETETENWNFLKYGGIGKHPVQSLYARYYIPYLVIMHV